MWWIGVRPHAAESNMTWILTIRLHPRATSAACVSRGKLRSPPRTGGNGMGKVY